MTRRNLLASAAAQSFKSSRDSGFIKGICSAVFPAGTSYVDCMRQARNAGFQAVELKVGEAELPMDCSLDAARRLADAATGLGMRIASLWALTPSSPSLSSLTVAVQADARARVFKAIELAPTLGCEAILVTPAVLGKGEIMEITSDEAWQRGTAAFRDFLPKAKRSKVMLTPENVWNRFLVSPRDMRDFVDQFRSEFVRVHFDVGNVLQFGYPEDWILGLRHRIQRLHFKDYKLARGRQGAFVPLLEGDVQWKSVMAALSKIGYRGFVTAETGIDPADPNSLIKISRAMDRIFEMA